MAEKKHPISAGASESSFWLHRNSSDYPRMQQALAEQAEKGKGCLPVIAGAMILFSYIQNAFSQLPRS